MAFTRITEEELDSRGCTTLPNHPTISAQALKEEFDAPAKEIVAPKVNNLMNELEATTAAASVGAVAPTGMTGDNVQAILNQLASSSSSVIMHVGANDIPLTDIYVSTTDIGEGAALSNGSIYIVYE